MENDDGKKKKFLDFDELRRISEIKGMKRTINLVNKNSYLNRGLLRSIDVNHVYDFRYFDKIEKLPVSKIVNGFNLHYYCSFAFDLLENISVRSGKKVLDVGCGNGNLALALASIDYDVVGIDLSEKSIKNALEKKAVASNILDNVNFKVADLAAISDRFDHIIFSDVIEHLSREEVDRMLSSARKVLHDRGFLIIHTPNGRVRPHRINEDYLPFSLAQKGYQILRALGRIKKKNLSEDDLLEAYYSQAHINVMTPKQIRELLEKNGFNEIQWFFRHDRKMPFARLFSFFGLSTDIGVVAKLGKW